MNTVRTIIDERKLTCQRDGREQLIHLRRNISSMTEFADLVQAYDRGNQADDQNPAQCTRSHPEENLHGEIRILFDDQKDDDDHDDNNQTE